MQCHGTFVVVLNVCYPPQDQERANHAYPIVHLALERYGPFGQSRGSLQLVSRQRNNPQGIEGGSGVGLVSEALVERQALLTAGNRSLVVALSPRQVPGLEERLGSR